MVSFEPILRQIRFPFLLLLFFQRVPVSLNMELLKNIVAACYPAASLVTARRRNSG